MSLVDIVSAISVDVVAKMAAAGLPPLVDGQIVIGKGKDEETSAPPRIVFIPVGFRFEARSNPVNYAPTQRGTAAAGAGIRSFTMTAYGSGYSGTPTVTIGAPDVAGGTQATASVTLTSNGAIAAVVPTNAGSGYLAPPAVTISGTGAGATATANLQPNAQARTVAQQAAVLTEWHKFEVRCWGANSVSGVLAPDPTLDYAATQQLYAQVIASSQALFPGVHIESGGQWLDAQAAAVALDVLGRRASFFLEVASPVLREPMTPQVGPSVGYAPTATQPNITTTILPSTGGVAVANATNASPIQITTATAHGLTTGQSVPINGVTGNTAANGFFTVTVVDALNFTLNGTTGNGAYAGGGTVGAGTAASG